MWGAQRRRVWSNNVTSLYSSMEKTCTFSASSMALSEDIRVQDRHFPSIFEAKVLCDRFLIRWKLSEVFLEVLFSPSIREAIINMSCFSPPRKCERPQFGRHLNWREAHLKKCREKVVRIFSKPKDYLKSEFDHIQRNMITWLKFNQRYKRILVLNIGSTKG